jgi:hypothetical protein
LRLLKSKLGFAERQLESLKFRVGFAGRQLKHGINIFDGSIYSDEWKYRAGMLPSSAEEG